MRQKKIAAYFPICLWHKKSCRRGGWKHSGDSRGNNSGNNGTQPGTQQCCYRKTKTSSTSNSFTKTERKLKRKFAKQKSRETVRKASPLNRINPAARWDHQNIITPTNSQLGLLNWIYHILCYQAILSQPLVPISRMSHTNIRSFYVFKTIYIWFK